MGDKIGKSRYIFAAKWHFKVDSKVKMGKMIQTTLFHRENTMMIEATLVPEEEFVREWVFRFPSLRSDQGGQSR